LREKRGENSGAGIEGYRDDVCVVRSY